MRKLLPICCILISLLFINLAANAQQHFFSTFTESAIDQSGLERKIIPQKYQVTAVNIAALKSFLWTLPSEKDIIYRRNNCPIIELPMPDGNIGHFRVWESSIQEPELAAKFPDIKTFAGQGIDDPYATIRFDLTPFGFHAQILSINGNVYIDPYARGTDKYCISYFTKDYSRSTDFFCGVSGNTANKITNVLATGPCRGTQLFSYRLAVACTGEYAVAVGGRTAALLHAAIVTSVNRVDGVYENEIAVRLVLVAKNDTIEYRTASTDPFNGNNNSNTLITESQSIITSRIGSANFDIGHTFSTGGGGLAGLGVVCNTSSKARGITGSTSPLGDAYDIDYVAHEMGHQFGADHTFNSVLGSCGGGNRNASTAYEVGSGTTIMAYAGLCSQGASNDDIQLHSDAFFHSISYDEISNFLQGGGSSCKVAINTGNTLPIITSMSNNNANIPLNTPFTLKAFATDADGDALTYCWEEWDYGGNGGAWNSGATSTTAPLFKSRVPKTTGNRTFPDSARIIANYLPATPSNATVGNLKGETLPTVARAMKFRLTVRDNRASGGAIVTGGNGCQTGFTNTFQINAIAATGPFKVTSPNNGTENWPVGSSKTITWNVAGTNAAPINTTAVKLLLSTDGGRTYPIVISDSTANDGTEQITVPNAVTTTARVKIEAIGNVYFDISDSNFIISATTSGFSFNSVAPTNVFCGSQKVQSTITSVSQLGFTSPITLSASGAPTGTNVTFGSTTITPGNSTTVTLNNINSLSPGTYNITVTGTATGASTQSTIISFIITGGSNPLISSQPKNDTVTVGGTATFTAQSSTSGVSYQWMISTDGGNSYTNISSGGSSQTLSISNVTNTLNNYMYKVKISTACGSVTSLAVVLIVSSAPPISADTLQGNIMLRPNPVSQNSHFSIVLYNSSNSTTRNVSVFESNGSRVFNSNYTLHGAYNELVVNTAKLSAGLYFVAIKDEYGNLLTTKKLIVSQ